MSADFDNPESVVGAFIAAMHEWESTSWAAMRAVRDSADPSSYQAGVLQSMEAVFSAYCTARSRPRGRQGSFQKPPEYDPDREAIVGSGLVKPGVAHVDTDREAVLGGGRYRYVLHRREGKWLIDSLRFRFDGKWEVVIL